MRLPHCASFSISRILLTFSTATASKPQPKDGNNKLHSI
ncbi:Uncharacterised protein [Vibrio cholerae]|nr:Uncharacterised protein [Vibrio cholerae]